MQILKAFKTLFEKPSVDKPIKQNYALEEYKNQIIELEYTITELKNKETLNLKQINDLINDKDELKEKVKQQLQELSIKESELNRQRETLHELKRYKEMATEKLTDQIIVNGLTPIGNKIIGYMGKVKKIYTAKELQDVLDIKKPTLWKHLWELDKKGLIEIHGETRSKYFVLTDKYKEFINLD
jgi:DNA-binding MarR family transcriptional regulator